MPPISVLITNNVQNVSEFEVETAARQTRITHRIIVKQCPENQNNDHGNTSQTQTSSGQTDRQTDSVECLESLSSTVSCRINKDKVNTWFFLFPGGISALVVVSKNPAKGDSIHCEAMPKKNWNPKETHSTADRRLNIHRQSLVCSGTMSATCNN